MDSQTYNYLRNTIYPLLQSMFSVQQSIDSAVALVLELLRFGVVIGLFAFLWFFASKFVQTILYK